MCGIGGYKNLSSSSFELDKKLLDAMQHTLSHRGPDGYRLWTSAPHQIGLFHRRLSIIDVSQEAYGPFFDATKTIVVSCNGEIYNYRQLRAELQSYGHQFRTDCDTEVIVYAYKQWGIACLDRFNGMFAIIIVDLVQDVTYLVRDRIGIKPLYFALQNGILSFASEIKALWALPWNQRRVNQQSVSHYLTYMVTPAPFTLFDQIYKLPAGTYMCIDEQSDVSFVHWYDPITKDFTVDYEKTEAQWIVDTDMALERSVQRRLISDVPLGILLSGGVDSSLLVSYAHRLAGSVKTFNISFNDGPEYSEVAWARRVSQQFNTEHHEIVIGEQEAFDFYDTMVHHLDEPIADCVNIPIYYVSKLLKDTGVTVVCTGEGADELFCGYQSYVRYLTWYTQYWKYVQRYTPSFIRKGLYRIAGMRYGDKYEHMDLMYNWSHGQDLFYSAAVSHGEYAKQKLYIQNMSYSYDPIVEKLYPGMRHMRSYDIARYHGQQLRDKVPHADFVLGMIYRELKQRLPELLLTRIDKMTMATSVEARVPFLDHELVALSLSMPTHFKYKNGIAKYILKKVAEQSLDREILYRTKVGFAAPRARWLSHGRYFKPYFLHLLHDRRDQWDGYLNFSAIEKLYYQHTDGVRDNSLSLWTIQQLLAVEACV